MIEVGACVRVIDLDARRHGIQAEDWPGEVVAASGDLVVIRYGNREGSFWFATGEQVDLPGRVFRTTQEDGESK